MSEFICRNGHLLKSGEFRCSCCGEKIHQTDGISRSEIRNQEMQDAEIKNEEGIGMKKAMEVYRHFRKE